MIVFLTSAQILANLLLMKLGEMLLLLQTYDSYSLRYDNSI